jgi:hypothetical protein
MKHIKSIKKTTRQGKKLLQGRMKKFKRHNNNNNNKKKNNNIKQIVKEYALTLP